MPNHLYFNTIYLQPLTIMDIIQAYTIWAKKHENYRQYQEIEPVDDIGIVKEIIEEFFIDGITLTSRILLDPTNPSIILLETLGIESQIENIRANNDEYLNLNTCIRLNAGRNFASSTFEVDDTGPESVLSGGGLISDAQGVHIFDTYFSNTDVWQNLGYGYKMKVEKIGCHYMVTFYDSNSKSTYRGGTAGGHNTNIMLNYVASHVPGNPDPVDGNPPIPSLGDVLNGL